MFLRSIPVYDGTSAYVSVNNNIPSIGQMKKSNEWEHTGSRDDIIAMGYEPCKRCNL